jgi:anti-anti-sigma regulatory factor
MLPSGHERDPGVRRTSWDRKVVPPVIATLPGDAWRVTSEPTPRPRAPAAFTEQVDQRRGSVRAAGHLTPQAADLLRGTVLALRGGGHPRVVVELGDVDGADESALVALETLRTTVAEDGGRLLIVGAPGQAAR